MMSTQEGLYKISLLSFEVKNCSPSQLNRIIELTKIDFYIDKGTAPTEFKCMSTSAPKS